MYPTLSHAGTFVLHSRLALRFSPLERGNLVTAGSPFDPAHQILKRVIGLPGDTVCVDPTGERKELKNEWCTVPRGHVWFVCPPSCLASAAERTSLTLLWLSGQARWRQHQQLDRLARLRTRAHLADTRKGRCKGVLAALWLHTV